MDRRHIDNRQMRERGQKREKESTRGKVRGEERMS